MEINGASGGAATYAMKKALETSATVMNVVQNSGNEEGKTLAMKTPEAKPVDIAAATGKGRIVDIMV